VSPPEQPPEPTSGPSPESGGLLFATEPPLRLRFTFDLSIGGFRFEWTRGDDPLVIARGQLVATKLTPLKYYELDWAFERDGATTSRSIGSAPSSVAALIRWIRKQMPVAGENVTLQLFTDQDLGPLRGGSQVKLVSPAGKGAWEMIQFHVRHYACNLRLVRDAEPDPLARGRAVLRPLLMKIIAPQQPDGEAGEDAPLFLLCVTFNQIAGHAQFEWTSASGGELRACGIVRVTGRDELTWDLQQDGGREKDHSSFHLGSIRAAFRRWRRRFPVADADITGKWVRPDERTGKPGESFEPPFGPGDPAEEWIETRLQEMGRQLGYQFSPLARMMERIDADSAARAEKQARKWRELDELEYERQQRIAANALRIREQQRQKELAREERRKAGAAKAVTPPTAPPATQNQPAALPPVPVRLELPALEFQDTAFALADLRGYFLRERAASWWVSNQSDDLLCLPHCRIQRLDYQTRTALRVLGPLRGRALLSDEVGLGKTIEAGLVLKELLTRGMVRRFLVLTVPSLVDQWEEELADKFNINTVTTNHPGARDDAAKFWRDNHGIVASLHTLKQPAQLAVAREVTWDMLVVDEAHYLRNRDSQAWQAVNALPRQFLLLLTATPVQNSLEELYNLVTLLQPGQLPTPKEFRARFIDPNRPRQPREPEELRRLLGQVMIRNTRANAGLNLPSRRAETVLFEPAPEERAFWQEWEAQFRAELAALPAGQSNLWGRLLLQAAGSSPDAWRDALEKFPARAAARRWRDHAPLEESWKKKCGLLPPLTRAEGGLVVFTQFLATQAALHRALGAAGVETFVINGATPAAERQPVTEEFRRRGGALLLTHSGTEGRNLQFCHRLVNFDLPWNPMEIEQRIGRLHRLGQRHPVRIYNLVQAGTLQEHLLDILQEKLNLFELVVGETGLILGERFASDEFADEVLRRWRDSEGRVGESLAQLGDELAAARDAYGEVRRLDETLFAKDYESL
jgi:superfamily II DNA or RNA helicase